MKYILIDLTKHFAIPDIGKGDIKNHVHITRNNDTYEMFFILNGELYLEQDNISYELKENDVFFAEANSPYGGNNKLSTSQFYWIHFNSLDGIKMISLEEITLYIKNYNYVIIPQYFSLINSNHIRILLSEIRTFFEEKEPYKIKNSLFKAILNELEFLHNQNIKMPNSSKRFFDIVEYLVTNPNLNEFSSIKALAEHFGYNEKYLTRLFKKNLGVSPKDLLINIKLGIAKSYLSFSNIEIKQIAYYLNYNEVYFLKMFKSKVGLTPTQYRKTVTPDANGYNDNFKKILCGDIKVFSDEIHAIENQYKKKT